MAVAPVATPLPLGERSVSGRSGLLLHRLPGECGPGRLALPPPPHWQHGRTRRRPVPPRGRLELLPRRPVPARAELRGTEGGDPHRGSGGVRRRPDGFEGALRVARTAGGMGGSSASGRLARYAEAGRSVPRHRRRRRGSPVGIWAAPSALRLPEVPRRDRVVEPVLSGGGDGRVPWGATAGSGNTHHPARGGLQGTLATGSEPMGLGRPSHLRRGSRGDSAATRAVGDRPAPAVRGYAALHVNGLESGGGLRGVGIRPCTRCRAGTGRGRVCGRALGLEPGQKGGHGSSVAQPCRSDSSAG